MFRGPMGWAPGLVILLVAAFLIQCQSTDTRSADAGPIVLTIDDNGKTVTVPPGEVVRIELESNPSTGYDWYITELDETVVQKPEKTQKPISENKRIGAPVMETFIIKGQKTGQTRVGLAYFRVWEGADTAIKNFEVTLIFEP